jgi:SET domain-containing protein
MKLQLAPGLTIKRSPIHGNGCFATQFFRRRHKIAEYAGEKISNAEAKRRANRKTLRICQVNNRWSVDGSRGGNGTHYINHSCAPNAFMQIVYDHILFIALRDIGAGEEITIDYETTLHPDDKRCICGVRTCRGTINRV